MALLERGTFLGQLSSLMASARRGRGRLVLVVGEAGIGKTSLVDAFVAVLPTPTRVLWGTCDPISPPRPFGPIVDIAERLGGELRRALAEGRRDRVVESFLAVLQRPGAPPTLVVLDDVHWADEATLGLLQVLGRRVARLPALVVATYRDHDVGPDHPLRPTLGDIPMSAVTHLRLPPLSVDAVGRLSRGRLDARALHRVTGGNPFFVTEVLAADPPSSEPVPASVRDAVLAPRPDGSGVESLRCQLSSVPVMIPAFQGEPPQTAFVHEVGPCLWTSDYWWYRDESTVMAASVHYVVTPPGSVSVSAYYPAEPLVCE